MAWVRGDRFDCCGLQYLFALVFCCELDCLGCSVCSADLDVPNSLTVAATAANVAASGSDMPFEAVDRHGLSSSGAN